MAVEVLDIVSGAYQLLGRPSQEDLPWNDFLVLASDVVTGRLMDTKLVARGHSTLNTNWFTPTGRQMDVNPDWFSEPDGSIDNLCVKVEWQPLNAPATFVPYKAEIVAYERLDDLLRLSVGNETYVAFYNNQTEIAFSEATAVLTTRQYRIWYEEFGFSPVGIGDRASFPAGFVILCKYELAVKALDQVENPSPAWAEKRERFRKSLMPFFLQETERFARWNTSQYGNKVTRKLGYRPRLRGLA